MLKRKLPSTNRYSAQRRLPTTRKANPPADDLVQPRDAGQRVVVGLMLNGTANNTTGELRRILGQRRAKQTWSQPQRPLVTPMMMTPVQNQPILIRYQPSSCTVRNTVGSLSGASSKTQPKDRTNKNPSRHVDRNETHRIAPAYVHEEELGQAENHMRDRHLVETLL